MDDLLHSFGSLSISSPFRARAAAGAGVSVLSPAREEAEAATLLPRPDLNPFLFPNLEAKHKEIAPSSSVSTYLSSVEHHILGEYACFLKSVTPSAL
jgi:hypothetical protein